MADAELVKYLRAHIRRFGPDALRAKLLQEGVAETDIDAAIAEAVRPAARKPNYAVYAIFGIALLGVGAYLSKDASQNAAPVKSAPVGKAPADRMYLGHYGYIIKTPESFNVVTEFKDFQNKREIVYLYPKNVDTSNLNDEGLYAPMGIMRLEVSPLRVPEGRIGLDAVKTGVATTLQIRKATFTTQETQFAGLPAYIVTITQPFPLVQAFVIGTKVLYVLTGGAQDQNFNDTLASLHETAPKDTPSAGE